MPMTNDVIPMNNDHLPMIYDVNPMTNDVILKWKTNGVIPMTNAMT